jgi:hypothetical protein
MSANPTSSPTPSFLVCRGIQARAEYLDAETPIYKGNPFIEALPPVLDEDQAINALRRYPAYDESERLLPNHLRIHMIQNALHFFAPLPVHLDLEQRFSRMIREGYRMRNPMDHHYWRATNEKLKSYDDLAASSQILTNQARTLPHGFTIIGCPGVGKSTSLEAILSLYPQVIFHGRYQGRDLIRAQIVWLKLEAPFDSSTKGICLNFFQAVDDILDTNYERNYTTGRRTDELLLQMARVAANHGLGVLVIDEIQRLSRAKSGGAEKMLNFFVQLSNTIGIPVVLVGTFKARRILSGAVHQIRRGAGQGDMIWDRMPEGVWVTPPSKGQLETAEASQEKVAPRTVSTEAEVPGVWQVFLESLWRYQYVRTPCPLTEELAHALYDCTQGITDFAAKVFMLAQARAITTSRDGKEQLTANIIQSVALDSLRQAQPVLEALRMGDTAKLDEYEDMRHIDINPYLDESIEAQRSLFGLTDSSSPSISESENAVNGNSNTPSQESKPSPKAKAKKKKKTEPRTLAENDLRRSLEVSRATETTPESVLLDNGRIGSATEYLDESEAA